MKILTKAMMEELCRYNYPCMKFVDAIEKLKKDGWITVMNRKSSNQKKYLVCEELLKN